MSTSTPISICNNRSKRVHKRIYYWHVDFCYGAQITRNIKPVRSLEDVKHKNKLNWLIMAWALARLYKYNASAWERLIAPMTACIVWTFTLLSNFLQIKSSGNLPTPWKVEDPFSLLLMTWRRGEEMKWWVICDFTFVSWYLLVHSNFFPTPSDCLTAKGQAMPSNELSSENYTSNPLLCVRQKEHAWLWEKISLLHPRLWIVLITWKAL